MYSNYLNYLLIFIPPVGRAGPSHYINLSLVEFSGRFSRNVGGHELPFFLQPRYDVQNSMGKLLNMPSAGLDRGCGCDHPGPNPLSPYFLIDNSPIFF